VPGVLAPVLCKESISNYYSDFFVFVSVAAFLLDNELKFYRIHRFFALHTHTPFVRDYPGEPVPESSGAAKIL